MNNGPVKFFNDLKGLGFIKNTNSDQDYFVHVSGLLADISGNDQVTFDQSEGRKGINAVKVKSA